MPLTDQVQALAFRFVVHRRVPRADERPGELSLTATRGLNSLRTYFARYLPQAAMAAAVPIILLAWVASQDWLSLVVVVALPIAAWPGGAAADLPPPYK